MNLWLAFMALAILLHLADRMFGFGYILSAIALIVFGISFAGALGFSIADQEPYVAIIGPLILIPPIVRAVYSASSKPQRQPPDFGDATGHRDRNAPHALASVTAGASYLIGFAFHVITFGMAVFVTHIIFAKEVPPTEYATALIIGGGFLGAHIVGKYTQSILYRTIATGLGTILGALLFIAAVFVRLYREGHIALPA
jgi:hypothetical protein